MVEDYQHWSFMQSPEMVERRKFYPHRIAAASAQSSKYLMFLYHDEADRILEAGQEHAYCQKNSDGSSEVGKLLASLHQNSGTQASSWMEGTHPNGLLSVRRISIPGSFRVHTSSSPGSSGRASAHHRYHNDTGHDLQQLQPDLEPAVSFYSF